MIASPKQRQLEMSWASKYKVWDFSSSVSISVTTNSLLYDNTWC